MQSSSSKRRAVSATEEKTEVLDEQQQEAVIAELIKSWESAERLHRNALIVLGCLLVCLKLVGLTVPYDAPRAWDFVSAAIFSLSVYSLFSHRIVAISALVCSVLLTLFWSPLLNFGDIFAMVSVVWFGGLNLLYAAATFHFRVTAASSAADIRRLVELQYPYKQA